MKYRIVVDKDANGVPFNYMIQQRVFFLWFPLASHSTLEFAKKTLAKLNSSVEAVE